MYLVVWSVDAFEDMNAIVGAHPARKQEFAVALRRIAHQLAVDPFAVGESREDDVRVMFAGEVSVFYVVDEDEQTVGLAKIRLREP